MSGMPRREWTPSRTEQRLLWWLRAILQGVGGAGIVWAIVSNHLSFIIWAVLGPLALGSWGLNIAETVVRAARAEIDAQAREIERQEEREHDSPKD